MKKILIIGCFVTVAQICNAQLNSSNLNPPASAQPVPNSTTTEKSAPTAKPLIPVSTPTPPPIYPGGEVYAPPTQPNLIFPAAPPAPTQPAQKEPVKPIESTNNLNPTRPQRDEASRNNPVVQPN